MANVENTTSWKQIQQGVRETERLIGHKEFNLAMVKARQTLEYMVRCIAEKACLVEGDLSDTIDQLYEGRWISRSTKDHYHNIRILGNKAVHEGDDTAYDANQAYQLLLQEVQAFADEYSSGRPAARSSGSGARSGQGRSSSGNRRPVQQGNRRPRGPQLFGDGFLGQALLIIHFSRLYHLLQILNTVSPIHAISFRPRPAPAGFPAKQARLNQSLPIEQYRAILFFLVFSNFLFALPSV